MSLARVLFVLAVTRLSVILVTVSEVGFARLLSPTFILQVSVIAVAFIINLVAFYMVLKGMPSDLENSEKLRGRWRQLRISSVFFLVMKLLYLISEPLWQEALTRANAINVLVIVAAVWMAISFIRILIPGMIKAIKQK